MRRAGEIKKEIAKENPKVLLEIKKDLAFQIGRMIMNARLARGMTQEMLAKKMRTKQPAIARAESGNDLPSLRFLDTMAKKGFDSYLRPPQFAFMVEHRERNLKVITRNIKATDDYIVNDKYKDIVTPYEFREFRVGAYNRVLTSEVVFA